MTFCRDFSNIARSDFAETMNPHQILHLPWQVRTYGPLWTASSLPFESANGLLSKALTGTVNFDKLIVERYLRIHSCLSSEVLQDGIEDLTKRFCGVNMNSDWRKYIRLTDAVKKANIDYPTAKISSHLQFGHLQYDSCCYSRFSTSRDVPNSYIKFMDANSLTRLGQIEVFVEDNGMKMCIVRIFDTVDSIRCPILGASTPKYFNQVISSRSSVTVNLSSICAKLLRIDTNGETWLVELSKHFEHN